MRWIWLSRSKQLNRLLLEVWSGTVRLLFEHSLLDCFRQLLNLNVLVAQLVLELSLFWSDACQVSLQVVTLVHQLFALSFEFCFLVLDIVLELFVLLRELIVLLPRFYKLVLLFFDWELLLADLVSNVLFEVNIRHSLLHHKVNWLNCFFDVLRPRFEKITNRGNTVALLRLANVVQVVLETCDLGCLIVSLLVKRVILASQVTSE